MERRFAGRHAERGKEAPLQRLICLAKEMKREMHSIGPNPGNSRARIELIAQIGQDTADFSAGLLIDVNRDKKPFHSISQRRTISSAACDA
jgi:hypothetical protein